MIKPICLIFTEFQRNGMHFVRRGPHLVGADLALLFDDEISVKVAP